MRKKNRTPLVSSRELANHLGVTCRAIRRYKSWGIIEPVQVHPKKHLWPLRESVQALHGAGLCEEAEVPL